MQVSSFIPAAPPSSVPGAPQSGPGEQGFDSVYEERGPRPPETDRAPSSDAAARRKRETRDAEAPTRTEEQQRTEGPDRREAGEEGDATLDEAAADGPDGTAGVEAADEAEIGEGADAAEAPDEPAVAIAEAPPRETRARTPEAPETQRATSAPGAETPQAQPERAETPTAQGKADTDVPGAVTAGKPSPQSPAAEVAQARAVPAQPEAEEVQVRRVRSDQTQESADGTEPRIDTRPRDAEVRMPKATVAAAVPDAPLRPTADPAVHLAADAALAEVGATEIRTTAEHAARAEATVRHDTPRPVMQQMAEAARALRDGPVELTLQPEELGKVRMTLTAGAEGNLTMSLQAERSETLELLRRHIGDLARELQDLGFSNLNFSFGQDGARPGQDRPADRADGADGEHPVTVVPLSGPGLANRPNMAPISGGLDLRL